FEDGRDALAGIESRVDFQRLRLCEQPLDGARAKPDCRHEDGNRAARHHPPATRHCCHCCPGLAVVVTRFAHLRPSSAAWSSSSLMSYQLIHAKPISSIVRLPWPTQLVGSGLPFRAELSCQLMTCSTVPAG